MSFSIIPNVTFQGNQIVIDEKDLDLSEQKNLKVTYHKPFKDLTKEKTITELSVNGPLTIDIKSKIVILEQNEKAILKMDYKTEEILEFEIFSFSCKKFKISSENKISSIAQEFSFNFQNQLGFTGTGLTQIGSKKNLEKSSGEINLCGQDILFEIGSFLDGKNLLNMTVVNKTFYVSTKVYLERKLRAYETIKQLGLMVETMELMYLEGGIYKKSGYQASNCDLIHMSTFLELVNPKFYDMHLKIHPKNEDTEMSIYHPDNAKSLTLSDCITKLHPTDQKTINIKICKLKENKNKKKCSLM